MTTVYLDTSALLRLVHPEPGSALAAALWNRASVLATSRTADVELRATLAAAERRGLLDHDDHAAALETWTGLWPALYVVELAPRVAQAAAGLVARHALRGGDAVHLASALVLGPGTIVAVWDEHVAAAAAAEGLTVLPGRYGLPGAGGTDGASPGRREPGAARRLVP